MPISILISGIGIAGPTLAYWLLAHGMAPTLMERAPHLRTGGYAIDFWGLGYDIAEKMGIMPQIRRDGYNVKELRQVNEHGRRIGGFNVDIFRAATRGRYVSIPRSDLARHLYQTVEGRCEAIFGDSISEIRQRPDGVDVTFENSPARSFDMVIGADGLHSVVRKLAFGTEERFEKFLGYSVAAFETTGYQSSDEDVFINYSQPGTQVGRFTMRNNRTLFLFVFSDEGHRQTSLNDFEAQRDVLRMKFGDLGWECPQILAALDSCGELYFDHVSQICMDSWCRDRIGLVGDAAFCPSLLAGQGSALAMIGAYVIAGELSRAGHNPAAAFQRYEQRLQPFMRAKQKAAEQFAGAFTPKTRWGLFLRNQAMNAFKIPFVPRLLMGTALLDRIELPDYSEDATATVDRAA